MLMWRMKGCFLLMCLVQVLSGCASGGGGFDIKSLAKSDIDLVAEVHRESAVESLMALMVKLYKRNPRELKKQEGMTIEGRREQFLALRIEEPLTGQVDLPFVSGKSGVDVIRLAFEESYTGDRVFTLLIGMADMIAESYSRKDEFYLFDELDQQKLYDSARNLEIVAWLLRTKLGHDERPLLLNNHMSLKATNLSFERLFGKLIANQDMMAKVVAGKTQRAINTVAHSVMSMTLIPL